MKPKLSIIYCYRNRELERVERSLRSLSPFAGSVEIIFVDYGSDEPFAENAKSLVQEFPSVIYVYNETRGRPWNRSHALNTGARLATSDYLFMADVDLVFATSFLTTALRLAGPDRATFFSVYLAPRGFGDWDNIEGYTDFPKTTRRGLGISLIPRQMFIDSGGFDEFFSIWGYEDNEFYNRLTALGFDAKFHDQDMIAYHQWHPSAFEDEFSFPRGWRLFMRNAFMLQQQDRRALNFSEHGILYTRDERKVLDHLERHPLTPLAGGLPYMRYKVAQAFHDATAGAIVGFEFTSKTASEFETSRAVRLMKAINTRLNRSESIPYRLTSRYEDLNVSVHQVRDMMLYFVVESGNLIRDYGYALDGRESIRFALEKK